MTDLERAASALQNAHAAGDVEAARAIANALKTMQAQASAPVEQTPDGRAVAPGTTEAMAANVPEGMIYDPERGQYVDTAAIAERMGPGQGASASYLAGTPFVGEWVDEGMGRLDEAMTGRPRQIGQEVMRQSREQFREDRPGLATTAEIAGGVVGSLPFIAGGVGVAQKATTRVGQIGRGFAMGAAGGAAEGAVQGAGRGDRGARAQSALQGAAVGGGLGGTFGAGAPLLADAFGALIQRAKRLDVGTIARELGISPAAARTVKGALLNDDLTLAGETLKGLGEDAMLADAGPGTGVLLDAASKTGGRALRTTREAVEGRASAAGARLNQALDDILGAPQGVNTTAKRIARGTATARKAAYDRAYAAPIDYSGPGRNIEAVLERVPSRTLQRAVREANEAMQEGGFRNMQIMAEIADDGAVTFREMPNVQQLDAIKRALGDIANAEVDQFGRKTAAGQRAARLAGDLRDALTDAVPQYRRALQLGGDKLEMDQALELGRDILRPGTRVEDVLEATRKWPAAGRTTLPVPLDMAGAPTSLRDAAKLGLRQHIEETLSNVRRTITDPNTDAREAMKAVSDLSSRANRAKVRMILGQSEADRLFSEIDRTANALALRGVVARNSDTAIRQAVQGQVSTEAAPGFIRSTIGRAGNPLDAARQISETLTGIDPKSISAREQEVFAEIAQALTGIRGTEAQSALATIERAMRGQPIKDAEAARIGRLLASGVVATGYQGSAQALQTR